MKQLLHQLNTGAALLIDTPVPSATESSIVVCTEASIISAGTERMLVEFGRAGMLEKVRRQPDKARQVFDKVRAEGIGPTMAAVRDKLETPVALGYCQAGVIVEAGTRAASKFARGDRVVTNGPHSEYVRVPMTLAAKIPDEVSFEAAAFTPLAAIGLQGIRLCNPGLDETVIVYGLGLIGLLTVQLLRATGCRVIGIDRDSERLALASRFGARTIDGSAGSTADAVLALTDGVGADAVLLTLASSSDDPVHEAAVMSRKRGRIVLVGVTGLHLNRDDFYRKELSFSVSCSYGPGRYDPAYEEQAHDYPLAYVRWTEQRNFEAVLNLLADGRLDPRPLISHRFPFSNVAEAYDLIAGKERSLGVVLQYPARSMPVDAVEQRVITRRPPRDVASALRVGFIGSGNYATRMLMPEIRKAGMDIVSIASTGAVGAAIAAEKFEAERVASDPTDVLNDGTIGSVFVATRHDSHARIALRALEVGKSVFVEKPLALTLEELDELQHAALKSPGILTVGFNRRFAPLTVRLSERVRSRTGPISLIATINAGMIPREHWTQDPVVGGGRIVGEAVHWIDLARSIVGTTIDGIQVAVARDHAGRPIEDISMIVLHFADGSLASINYLASGAKSYPKERIECFVDGQTFVIENWKKLRQFGGSVPRFMRARAIDKGQNAEIAAWKRAVTESGEPPIPLDELFEVSRWAVRAAELARAGGGSAE
jgi:predicted dehydrogenase/threonine dehydrogenase-like Zn-dependent dehydrogenase